jgi:hypothetical protein
LNAPAEVRRRVLRAWHDRFSAPCGVGRGAESHQGDTVATVLGSTARWPSLPVHMSPRPRSGVAGHVAARRATKLAGSMPASGRRCAASRPGPNPLLEFPPSPPRSTSAVSKPRGSRAGASPLRPVCRLRASPG